MIVCALRDRFRRFSVSAGHNGSCSAVGSKSPRLSLVTTEAVAQLLVPPTPDWHWGPQCHFRVGIGCPNAHRTGIESPNAKRALGVGAPTLNTGCRLCAGGSRMTASSATKLVRHGPRETLDRRRRFGRGGLSPYHFDVPDGTSPWAKPELASPHRL